MCTFAQNKCRKYKPDTNRLVTGVQENKLEQIEK